MPAVAHFRETSVHRLPLYKDNYAWLITKGSDAWIIDPGHAQSVKTLIQKLGVSLRGMLITHRHWDHVNGIDGLLAEFDIPVYGSKVSHNSINHYVQEGDHLNIGDLQIQVWATPGHVVDHLSYFCPEAHWIFCGDTLFSAGCGRLLATGDMADLYASTQRIGSLDEECWLFCSHEYTQANLAFAAAVEPANREIAAYREQVAHLRDKNEPTIPSQLAREKKINPFLRSHMPEVRAMLEQRFPQAAIETNLDYFRLLREWKDSF